MSILNESFQTVHDTAPFSQIKIEDYIPAFDKAITETKQEIDAITHQTDYPTFENTIESMAYSGLKLDRISKLFIILHAAETNDEMDRIWQG